MAKLLPISEMTFRPFHADLAFESITHRVKVSKKNEKVIIDNASGSFKHGKLHAIMGPSGCGKSSLLNVLAGFNPVATGKISFNGNQYQVASWAAVISPVRSYLLQDDFLVRELTVLEQLTYSVELKVPNGTSAQMRAAMVNTLLRRTCLQDCAHRYIGLLSGGQRKRVCVASELVNYPPVLFLDEPTTGLDSTSCYRLVELLKTVAQSGCNVIATIHQPNSRVFAIFDTLTVLYDGGVVAYTGPANALAESLQRLNSISISRLENPADVLFEGDNIKQLARLDPVFRRQVVEEAAEQAAKTSLCYKSWARLEGDDSPRVSSSSSRSSSSTAPNNVTVEDKVPEKQVSPEEVRLLCESTAPSSSSRFRSLFRRTLIQTQRDIVFMIGRIVAYVCTSALVGLTFQGAGSDGATAYSNFSLMFIFVQIYTLGTCIVTIMSTQNYLEVMLHENINSWYGVTSFYVIRTIIEAIFNTFIAFVFSIAIWMMTGQQVDPIPTIFGLACAMTIFSIGIHHASFLIAMFSDKASLPQMPFLLVMIQVISAGYFVRLRDLPVWFSWIQYVNFGSYIYTALLKLAFSPVTTGRNVVIPCKSGHPLCNRFRTGLDVLEERGVSATVSYWNDIEATAFYDLGLAVAGWALIAVYLRKAKRTIARL